MLKSAGNADPNIEVNWAVVKDWDEGGRYERHSEAEARDLLSAINDGNSGILTWLKNHW